MSDTFIFRWTMAFLVAGTLMAGGMFVRAMMYPGFDDTVTIVQRSEVGMWPGR